MVIPSGGPHVLGTCLKFAIHSINTTTTTTNTTLNPLSVSNAQIECP